MDYLSYELQDLAQHMEYNHQQIATHDPKALFWAIALAVWAAVQTLLFLGVTVVETSRRFENTQETRQQLAELELQLEQLAIGLDMSRLESDSICHG